MAVIRFHGWRRVLVEVDTGAGLEAQGGVELRYALPGARDVSDRPLPPEQDTHAHLVSDAAVYRRMLLHQATAEAALFAVVLEVVGERRLQTRSEQAALRAQHVFQNEGLVAAAAAAIPPASAELVAALRASLREQFPEEELLRLAR